MANEDRPVRSSVRGLIALLAGATVVFFAAINLEPVRVQLVFWQPDVSTALLILVPLLLGIAIGWTGAVQRRGRRRVRKTAPEEAETVAPGPGEEPGAGGGPGPGAAGEPGEPGEPEAAGRGRRADRDAEDAPPGTASSPGDGSPRPGTR